jgi:hypothetical protein
MQPLHLELLALVLLVPLIGILHELGHAGAAPLAGYRVTSLGLGVGKPMLRRVTMRGMVLWLGRWPLAGGACVAIPARMNARPVIYHLGGLAMQALLALLLAPLVELHWVLARAASFNLLVLAWNILPWRFGGQASDGWYLVARLAPGRARMPLMGRRSVLERLARFEESVGSPLGSWYARLGLAWHDIVLGRPERADELMSGPEPLGLEPEDRGVRALLGYLQVAWHGGHGRWEQALELARSWRARLGSAVPDRAEDLVTIAVAQALVGCGRPDEARQVLASLAGVSGAIGREATATLLAACLAEGEREPTRRAAWRFMEKLPGPFYDPVQVALLLRRAARSLPDGDAIQPRLRRASERVEAGLLAWVESAERPALAARLEAARGG